MFVKETAVDQLPAELHGLWNRCCGLLEKVKYKDRFKLYLNAEKSAIYIEVGQFRPDAITNDWAWGRGGKAYLRPEMSDRDIVARAFHLFWAYEEHECREFFRFDDVAVFGPHITLEALHAAGQQTDPIQ